MTPLSLTRSCSWPHIVPLEPRLLVLSANWPTLCRRHFLKRNFVNFVLLDYYGNFSTGSINGLVSDTQFITLNARVRLCHAIHCILHCDTVDIDHCRFMTIITLLWKWHFYIYSSQSPHHQLTLMTIFPGPRLHIDQAHNHKFFWGKGSSVGRYANTVKPLI